MMFRASTGGYGMYRFRGLAIWSGTYLAQHLPLWSSTPYLLQHLPLWRNTPFPAILCELQSRSGGTGALEHRIS